MLLMQTTQLVSTCNIFSILFITGDPSEHQRGRGSTPIADKADQSVDVNELKDNASSRKDDDGSSERKYANASYQEPPTSSYPDDGVSDLIRALRVSQEVKDPYSGAKTKEGTQKVSWLFEINFGEADENKALASPLETHARLSKAASVGSMDPSTGSQPKTINNRAADEKNMHTLAQSRAEKEAFDNLPSNASGLRNQGSINLPIVKKDARFKDPASAYGRKRARSTSNASESASDDASGGTTAAQKRARLSGKPNNVSERSSKKAQPPRGQSQPTNKRPLLAADGRRGSQEERISASKKVKSQTQKNPRASSYEWSMGAPESSKKARFDKSDGEEDLSD
jgi:hypothetical protein